ncbi:MAG: Glu/Leu/Phe/Val dehydrogenase [Alphaproteobacteria bacterium]
MDAFAPADDLGPAKVLHLNVPGVGLRAAVVVDNTAAGPSIGGIRMAPDVSLAECARLARAMTLKNAAAGLAHGGGKAVIFADPKMAKPQKENLIRAFACAIRNLDDYIPGPDMGTDETCMAWIKDEIGRVAGLPRELGGIPIDEIGATGWGLSHAVEIAAPYSGFVLDGARVAVQGYGAVGKHAVRFLAKKGAVLVAASDSRGTVADDKGLDLEGLAALKEEGRSVVDYPKGRKLDRDGIIDIECEIWIPAARPDVIRDDNVARLKTKLVAQGANIPLTPGAEKYLHERGVICLPDFIANAGGVICAAMEYHGASEAAALATVAEKLRANASEVLTESKGRKILPREAAMNLVLRRVKKAMSLRRWGLF